MQGICASLVFNVNPGRFSLQILPTKISGFVCSRQSINLLCKSYHFLEKKLSLFSGMKRRGNNEDERDFPSH